MMDIDTDDKPRERRMPREYGDTYIWRLDYGCELQVFRGKSGGPRRSMPVEYAYGVWSFRAVKR